MAFLERIYPFGRAAKEQIRISPERQENLLLWITAHPRVASLLATITVFVSVPVLFYFGYFIGTFFLHLATALISFAFWTAAGLAFLVPAMIVAAVIGSCAWSWGMCAYFVLRWLLGVFRSRYPHVGFGNRRKTSPASPEGSPRIAQRPEEDPLGSPKGDGSHASSSELEPKVELASEIWSSSRKSTGTSLAAQPINYQSWPSQPFEGYDLQGPLPFSGSSSRPALNYGTFQQSASKATVQRSAVAPETNGHSRNKIMTSEQQMAELDEFFAEAESAVPSRGLIGEPSNGPVTTSTATGIGHLPSGGDLSLSEPSGASFLGAQSWHPRSNPRSISLKKTPPGTAPPPAEAVNPTTATGSNGSHPSSDPNTSKSRSIGLPPGGPSMQASPGFATCKG